ncbi:MAG: sulfatase-like hydrolase/transferase [Planctomycetes bacterium]|nr:sulfatase-like hydrolase/transferase [Planctomycetota bacterium]
MPGLNTDRPNILFLHTDQHRFDYMGCAGADFLNTPNLDRLAERGIRFNNCMTNSPLCAPARIGLATGMQPARVGSLGNDSFVPPDMTTYYMRLRDAGYRVGAVGKLDLAKPDSFNGRYGDRPCVYQWGFTHPEEIEGKVHSLHQDTPNGPYGLWLKEKGMWEDYRQEAVDHWREPDRWITPSELPTETFLDSYQGQRAVDWVNNIGERFPWHLFVTFSGPHVPHDPPREFADRYEGKPMPEAVPIPEWDDRPNPSETKRDPEFIQQCRRMYCAYIELIDHWIGRILDALEQRGWLEDTYIFFSSDHGEMLGDLGRYSKKYPYEPSLHVPLLASGPGIPQGQTSEALVETIDLNPTICELAGLHRQPSIDARSMCETLVDPSRKHRDETVSVIRSWQCVRTDRYKLVHNFNTFDELYDLHEDPGEQRNIYEEMAEKDPDLIRDLRRRIGQRHGGASPYGQPRG